MTVSDQKQVHIQILELRLQRADAHLAVLRHTESRYPWIRLGVFLAGVGATLVAFLSSWTWLGWIVLAAFLSVFWVVAAAHRRVFASIRCFEIMRRLVAEQIARSRLDWDDIPIPASFPAEKDHPFEFDLNITGSRSLHQLIDTAASRGGSARLRDWLLARSPDRAAVSARQSILRELLPRYGFRARLALSGAMVIQKPGRRWDGEKLLAWLERPSEAAGLRPYLLPLFLLAGINLVLFILFALGRLSATPWLLGLAAFWALQGLKYRQTSELFEQATSLFHSLDGFRAVLKALENYPYRPQEKLTELTRPFWQNEKKPSRVLRRLSGIVTAASFRNNAFLGLFLNTVLPWDVFFTYVLERYKLELRLLLPVWLNVWYELESLCSLANFAVLNPDSVFPSFVEPESQGVEPAFSGTALGHPLIPDEARVNNDFSIQHLGEIVIVTGSNMSGKSTFLRTLGVNLVLANAGSVVCAQRLHCLPFRLYTCINLLDSLSDGISYFYAEVRRLKGLLNELRGQHDLPLFFLIDEIFRGTNNRERQQGSLAYTQALAGQYGTGLISTHDLELVRLSDEISGVSNYHFREDVRDGRMVFDFILRSGPSPTTNALKIMALEGLPTQPVIGSSKPGA